MQAQHQNARLGNIETCSPLGRSMPADADLPAVVTAWEHARYFCTFQNVDAWTPDGWLVTACFSGGEVQLRKADKVCNAILPASMLLRYKPNKSTAEWVDFMATVDERARVYDSLANSPGTPEDMAHIYLQKAQDIRRAAAVEGGAA